MFVEEDILAIFVREMSRDGAPDLPIWQLLNSYINKGLFGFLGFIFYKKSSNAI